MNLIKCLNIFNCYFNNITFLREKLSKEFRHCYYILSKESHDFFYVFKKKEKNTILRFMDKYILR